MDVCFSAEDVVEPMPLRTVQELEASFFGRFTAALDEYDSLDPALPAVAADVVAGVTPRRNHRLALLVARIVCWPNKQLTAALAIFF